MTGDYVKGLDFLFFIRYIWGFVIWGLQLYESCEIWIFIIVGYEVLMRIRYFELLLYNIDMEGK